MRVWTNNRKQVEQVSIPLDLFLSCYCSFNGEHPVLGDQHQSLWGDVVSEGAGGVPASLPAALCRACACCTTPASTPCLARLQAPTQRVARPPWFLHAFPPWLVFIACTQASSTTTSTANDALSRSLQVASLRGEPAVVAGDVIVFGLLLRVLSYNKRVTESTR